MIRAVQLFFQTGSMLKELNSTNIVLLPKTDHPRTAADYRPIACCGVFYKVIAKLISDKFQQVLPSIVNQTQSAFVNGQCILHNVMIRVELMRLYNRKKASPRIMLKVDIKKAYDSVNW